MPEVDEELEVIMTIKSGLESSKVQVFTSPVWEDPFAWGIVFVDAMRILAEAYAKEEGATDSRPYLERIKEGLEAEYKTFTSPITPVERADG